MMVEDDLGELEDRASEVVTSEPRRKRPQVASVLQAAQVPPGGRLASMRSRAAQTRQEFTMVRAPLGVTKVALPHLDLFGTLWRLWAAKRVKADSDPGISVGEIVEVDNRTESKVRGILATLIRNGIVRSIRTSVGWAGNRARYYPTELGTQVLAIAQMLGPGTSIQVGSTPSAWRSRAATEPANLFRHAAFLRGMG